MECALPLRGTAHFERRLRERYGMQLIGREYEAMLAAISCGEATFIRADHRRGTEIWELKHERTDAFVQVVYCPTYHQIVTALEPDSWRRIAGCWVQPWHLGNNVPARKNMR